MITEDYVSFETAKLLKEKGFDEPCNKCWYIETKDIEDVYNGKNSDLSSEFISAPTLQMVMKWLREVHNILLVVDYEFVFDTTPYYFKIYRLGENGKIERIAVKGVSYDKNNNATSTEHIVGYCYCVRSEDDYSTHEETCEAAIKYCLDKLI